MNNNMSTAKSIFRVSLNKPLFFYCCPNSFSHLTICLAEGLKELGIPFYSNINYWKISPESEEYLFRYDPTVTPEDCSVVVLDFRWRFNAAPFPENLFHRDRKYITVYLDDMDGVTIWNPDLMDFDFRFRTHYNSKSEYPLNCTPWVFGLSNRILLETSGTHNFQQRSRQLMVNFRVDQETLEYSNCYLRVSPGWLRVDNALVIVEHPLRQIVREKLFPRIQEILPVNENVDNFDQPPSNSYDYLQWVQTDKRHYPNYYKRLKESVACACFGGYISPILGTDKSLVEWWDTWRFWESFAAGCVTFHIDFDKYGIQLPVMPENWRHYIGIDLENIDSAVERIADDPEILEKISIEGQKWAIENYSPVPTALRFLETISSKYFGEYPPHKSPNNQRCFSLPFELRDVNLIVFPDWYQPEEFLSLDLQRVMRAIATHPDKSKITLLIDTSSISDEDANLVLSSVAMNLLMEEELDIADGPEISLIGQLSEIQWKTLIPHLHARIVLENENKDTIAQTGSENILSYQLDSFTDKKAVQLEAGEGEIK